MYFSDSVEFFMQILPGGLSNLSDAVKKCFSSKILHTNKFILYNKITQAKQYFLKTPGINYFTCELCTA